MRTPALASLLTASLLALPAAAAEPDPVLESVEAKIRQAAEAEKAEDCEAAWDKYTDADGRLGELQDRKRAAELESIVANKLDKIEECYQACQPSERQRGLMARARSFASQGEPRRATQIAKRLLVGRNEKCRFWKEARAFLRTLPKQAEEQDQDLVDPCAVSEETAAELQAVHEATRARFADLAMFEGDEKVASKLPELVELVRALDQTRLRIYELREAYLDCDSVYAPLAEDAQTLRGAFERTQGLVFTTYQGQVAGLSKKIQSFKKQLASRDRALAQSKEQLDVHKAELERLKTEFDELSAFNEEIFDDLFKMAGAESISFSSNVEGKRVEQPIEEIQALVADQAKAMKSLSANYPEYFQDGVNLEGLKRKKLALENLEKMLGRYGERGGTERLGYKRAMAEIDATIQMMDGAIERAESAEGEGEAQAGEAAAVPVGPIAGGGLLLLATVGGIVLVVRRRRGTAARVSEDGPAQEPEDELTKPPADGPADVPAAPARWETQSGPLPGSGVQVDDSLLGDAQFDEEPTPPPRRRGPPRR